MILKTLELENIRSYKRETIEFREGIALFEGDIGSGKSTILYAIEFALFGLGDLKSTFLLRNGEKEGCVKLILDVDGRELAFFRTLQRTKKGAAQKQCRIIADGTKAEYSPEEMKAEVLRILKFNENPSPAATSLIYRYAIFTPQEEMKEILRLREDARLETLRKAFGIEEYKTARNNAAIISREIREREAFISGSLAGLDALESEKKDLLAAIEKSRNELAEVRARSDAATKKIASLQKKISGHRQAKAAFDRLSGEIPALRKMLFGRRSLLEKSEKKISELNAEILDKKKNLACIESEKRPSEKTDDEVEAELRKIRGEISSASTDAGALENSINDAEAALHEAGEKKKALDKAELEIKNLGALSPPTEKTDIALSHEISEIRKRKDHLLHECGAALQYSKTLKKLIAEKACPTCMREISPVEFLKKSEDAGKSVLSMEAELKELMQKEKELEKERDALNDYNFRREKLSGLLRQKEILAEAHESAAKKCAGINEMRASMSELDAELEGLRAKEKELSKVQAAILEHALSQARCSQMRSEIDSLHARLEAEESGKKSILLEISSASGEISEKERECKQLEAPVHELSELEKEMDVLKSEQDRIAKNAGEAEARRSSLEDELKKIESEIARKESEKKEKDALSETRMWLDDYFSGALVSIERHVLATINEEFNVLFQRLFGILMDESELNAAINEFFTPTVSQNGYEQDINALSGGERTSVALAYRLALNSVVKNVCGAMNGSGLLILDEPTDGFSKEQLMRLRDALAELACRQVVIVSHERELESFADHIYRVRKAGSVSVVEKG